MSEAVDLEHEVDSPFEAGLAQSLEKLRSDGDTGVLIAWLSTYREMELESSSTIKDRIDRFKRVSRAFTDFYQSYQLSSKYNAEYAASEYIEAMEAALSKVIAIDEEMTQNANALRELLRARQFDALSVHLGELATADTATATARFLEGYRARLLSVPFVMSELSRVLVFEYNRRIEAVRERYDRYAESLREEAERNDRELTAVDSDMADLERDQTVAAGDKRALMSAFERRHEELLETQKSLNIRTATLASLLKEHRRLSTSFSVFLGSLQSRLVQHDARRDYLRRLEEVRSELPQLDSLLNDALESLSANAAMVQEVFLFIDQGFQNAVFDLIDRECGLSRIALGVKGNAEIRFMIALSLPAEKMRRSLDLSAVSSLPAVGGANGHAFLPTVRTRRSLRPRSDLLGPLPSRRKHRGT